MVRFLLSFFKFWFTYTMAGVLLLTLLIAVVPKTSGFIMFILGAAGYVLVIVSALLISLIAAYRKAKRDKYFNPETYEAERREKIR